MDCQSQNHCGLQVQPDKKSNILTKRMKDKNERFEMECLSEVIRKGVTNIEQNSLKVRDAIDVLNDVARGNMKDNEEYKKVQDQLSLV